jgi:hypothetical protein
VLGEALERGRDYLSVKLDDPSFNASIYANLFEDEDEGYILMDRATARRMATKPALPKRPGRPPGGAFRYAKPAPSRANQGERKECNSATT